MRKLGIDAGSLYLGCVLLEENEIASSRYIEHKGDIFQTLHALLSREEFQRYDRVGVTGNIRLPDGRMIDSTLALSEGARVLLPACRNVFSIGGETFSLILFDDRGEYREHSLNSPCAAGTGSFIEQQAERLNLSVGEFTRRAEAYRGKVPLVATRCAVFAKTDIVHVMQEGFSLDAVCAGLCEGIARNVLDVLVKGRQLTAPVGIVGGVSLNRKIVRSIEEMLGYPVMVPPHAELAGAVGAALLGESSHISLPGSEAQQSRKGSIREVLRPDLSRYPDLTPFSISRDGEVEVFLPRRKTDARAGVFLGIDIGSTSTKAALIDRNKEFAGGFYTATGGDPTGALAKLIRIIDKTFGQEKLPLQGAATTGSGRKIIGELFHADLVIDEITAHAKAAVFLNPQVDTILEIGGQDSKFTRLKDGEVYFSTMNYACAAGTGSFIEEQAQRLGVGLDEFSVMAFDTPAPYTSDRCTVYMERDLSRLLSEGWSREALAAAVLHSVRDNYLAKVVNKSPLGDYIVFQGATGRNPALIAAFEQFLQKPVHVSPYCHLTGAMGAALACLEMGVEVSGFFRDAGGVPLQKEACALCTNHCQLTVAVRNGQRSGWGMKCGREYGSSRVRKEQESAPEERFREAMKPLLSPVDTLSSRAGILIGLPKALYNADYFPLWHRFLSLLGFTVGTTETSRDALLRGKGIVNSDFCAPVVIAHGYIKQLLDRGMEHIFCPAVINEENPEYEGELLFRKKTSDSNFCYYSEYMPTIVDKLTTMTLGSRLISPLLFFNRASEEEIARDLHREMSNAFPDLSFEEIRQAFGRARDEFLEGRKRWAGSFVRAQTVMPAHGETPRIVFLGRPYVVFENALNLGIPRKLEELGSEVFWQEELELNDFRPLYAGRYIERMNWHYGKRVLKAAELCARTEGLFAVFLTCFRCSPDSFLISYVKDIMDHYGKPFLVLQLDEQHSDVGYTTRIEAGVRSFRNHMGKLKKCSLPSEATRPRNDPLEAADTVLIPNLGRLLSRFVADSFIRAGYRAVVLEADEKALNTGYRYANGGECMPLVSFMGGVIEKVRQENLDPRSTFFFAPTACYACNWPQFPILSDLVFQAAGLEGLKIGLIHSMDMATSLPRSLAVRIFESYILGSIIYKIYNRIKPYEVRPGDTDTVLQKASEHVSEEIRSGRDVRAALARAAEMFRGISRDESGGRKVRVVLLGDLYAKYNEVVNQGIQNLIAELGGELVIPSMSEYALHHFLMDVKLFGDDPRHHNLLRAIESRYEQMAVDLIGDLLEPDVAEAFRLMEDYGFKHCIAGETSVNLGRALYHIAKKNVEAIIHVNPIFCCPGVVTSSIYRKIQEDFGIPIIDIFYDGTGSPNHLLIPHMDHLTRKKKAIHNSP